MGDATQESLLQAKVALTVEELCRESGDAENAKFSRGAVMCLAKLVLDFSESFGEDLSHFQKHAKRTTITNDDVRLCARKSVKLRQALEEYEQVHCPKVAEKRALNDRKKAKKTKRTDGKENMPNQNNKKKKAASEVDIAAQKILAAGREQSSDLGLSDSDSSQDEF